MKLPATLVFLMGPTATGKTQLALQIAKHLPVEIISVDSALVYRGMDIGTAKPTAAERQQVPHHLIDILDPAESYSAAQFREQALALIPQIHARGRLPLLVGGTMLYFRALDFGLDKLPEADPQIRAEIEQLAQEQGWSAVHAQLAQSDPEAAARIHVNDPQRLQRALEVVRLTGQPLSLQQKGQTSGLPWPVLRLGLMPDDRAALRARIAERFESMLTEGLLAEVAGLRARSDLHGGLPAMRAVGYRQALAHLQEELDYSEMVVKAVTATRQLAKRQMTWLRHYPDTALVDPDQVGVERLLQHMNEHLTRLDPSP
ncbi:tRNA dimethylallyltransferase [Ectothiorhodosinus mongolicus]|uniref:tRNA dimethylallyltransferase n=1 Tax=Ectothiorhodosinus mongolicus TaxID=233100 RepID=A0A1R3W431_9GAMM|nr:tRNA (adenosine(37)-N6)-dimethylallyltransferase MiaA [Ectothiorhodosinus mongolicus]ULX57458.1 tRNA (adenosine(37)-N6)-dimethylallyltransferase MiaA [Ectothiorhodosinus mongolicus]SIT72301.1 tRNA dimethylallyltransferase [Ectothiorhodosinus mongolicus]